MKKIGSLHIIMHALFTAILLVAQVSLAFIPNVELVTLLIIIFTLITEKKIFYIIYAFVIIEGLIFGFGLWWISYLYIWTILALAVLIMKKIKSAIIWAIVASTYGLVYGALCGIPYMFIGGIPAFIAYWISGIPFDIIHCVSNFVCTLILFKPLYSLVLFADGKTH